MTDDNGMTWEDVLSDDMNGWAYGRSPPRRRFMKHTPYDAPRGTKTDRLVDLVDLPEGWVWVARKEMVEGQVYQIDPDSSPFAYHKEGYADKAIYLKSGTKALLNKSHYVQKEKEMTKKLYEFEIDFMTHYGHKLAVNSEGKWVMEVKGQSAPVAVNKEDVQEVIPYSIGVRFTGGNTQVYHYTADKGKFEKGLYLFNSAGGLSLCEVVELDTKSKMATKEFTPALKVVTEAIK